MASFFENTTTFIISHIKQRTLFYLSFTYILISISILSSSSSSKPLCKSQLCNINVEKFEWISALTSPIAPKWSSSWTSMHGSSKKGMDRFTPRKKQFYCPIQFFRRARDKAVNVLRLICTGKSLTNHHNKVCSPLSSRLQVVDESEIHRARSVEDCIKFLNSYSG